MTTAIRPPAAAELRAYDYLRRLDRGPSALAAALGRSTSTWSRLLRGQLQPEPDGIREQLEEFYRTIAGRSVPSDFWRPSRPLGRPGAADTTHGDTAMLLQAQSLSRAARAQWDLAINPFGEEAVELARGASDLYLALSHRPVLERVKAAISGAGFLALCGQSGSGKNMLLERALQEEADSGRRVKAVRPLNVSVRKITSVHLSAEIIRQLSTDGRAGGRPMPSAANERDARATEILTEMYHERTRVVMVIDDAHQLPASVLKELKRYWEMRHGFKKLLGIILVGQNELATTLGAGAGDDGGEVTDFALREVIQRCEVIPMPPMPREIGAYLAARLSLVGRHLESLFTDEAVQALEARLGASEHQYPLLINNAATAALNIAVSRGFTRVTEDDVEGVWVLKANDLQVLSL